MFSMKYLEVHDCSKPSTASRVRVKSESFRAMPVYLRRVVDGESTS